MPEAPNAREDAIRQAVDASYDYDHERHYSVFNPAKFEAELAKRDLEIRPVVAR